MSGDLRLSHTLDVSAVPFASERDLQLLASLVAPQMAEQGDRSPVDLIAVLDRCLSVSTAALNSRLLHGLSVQDASSAYIPLCT